MGAVHGVPRPSTADRRRRVAPLLAVASSVLLLWLAGDALASAPASPPTSEPPATSVPPTTSSPTTTEQATTTTAPSTTAPPVAPLVLVPLCTAQVDFDAGTRTFRIDNNGPARVDVVVQNIDTGASVSGVAGAGSSIWHVPAGGSNTAAVLVDGERVTSAPSTNLICFALVANSVCDVDAATTTVTWAINSNQAGLQLVVGDARGLAFAPNPIPPFGSATAVEVIAGPLVEQSISNTVLLQAGDRQSSSYSASLTIGACTGPSSLPDVTFTFTTRANSARASLGDTVSYEYCGQNTSDIPLEVVRLVDDRLGVLIELPSVTTIVEPGASLCNSDVGVAVEYVVIDADIGTTIANNAVVTVRTREPSPRTFQATSSAAVDVPILASLSAFMITSYGAEDVKICHATGAEGHWTTQFVDQSAATEGTGGHNEDNHQGGRDIIPPGPWDPDGRNWDAAAEVIWTYGCARPPTSPVAPTVTHATCAGGGVTNPIVLFDASLGIVYSANPPAPYSGTEGATVVVTATLKPGWQWGQIPKGWTASGADYQMTVVLSPSSCTAVAPVAPAVTQAVCHMGTEIPPTLVLAITDQIVYTTTPPAPYAAGTTVVVTATLAATGVAFPAALPPGWRLVDATHAAYDVRLDPSGCTPLQPLAPEIAPATCVNGRVTTPTVTPAVLPSGVVYLVVPDTPQDGSAGVTITVFAVVAPGYGWGQMPSGWVRVDDTKARFDAVFPPVSCDAVTPATPTLTQSACVSGVVTEPTLRLAATDGITYDAAPGDPYAPGDSVTITATLDETGVGWPEQLPVSWTRVDDVTATSVVHFDDVVCTPVSPVDPTVTGATCVNGEVTAPIIDVGLTTGVRYTIDPPPPFDGTGDTNVTVTATLSDGYEWGQLGAGWQRVDDVTSTFDVVSPAASCDEVTPIDPSVTPPVCVNGSVSEPALRLPTTDGVTYTADPVAPYSAGDVVVVTATLDDAGVAWPDVLPGGWVRIDATHAVFSVEFDRVQCTPVAPGAPGATPATCVNGAVSAPVVELRVTTGVVYTVEPAGPYVGTEPLVVTVDATVSNGFAWGQMPPGWARIDATRATLVIVLAPASCEAVSPAGPVPTQAVCVNGEVTAAELVLATTDGVTYSVVPDGPYRAGDEVTVTAMLDPEGVAWPDLMPVGWLRVDDTTATSIVRFDAVTCTPVVPTAPAVAGASCVNGAVTEPAVALPSTTGVRYSLDPPGPFDGTSDVAVTVTAVLSPGYEWGALPDAWDRVDAATATLEVELSGSTCDEVVAVAPALVQAQCVNGTVSAPHLVLATTDGIAYTVEPEGPYEAGQRVVITATLDPADVGWPSALPDGWEQQDDTTAAYEIQFDDVSCEAVELPPIVDLAATCVDGVAIAPTIALPETVGVVYRLDPADAGALVTATLLDGFAWSASAPEGWTIVDDITATHLVTITEVVCVAQSSPAPDPEAPAERPDEIVFPPTLTPEIPPSPDDSDVPTGEIPVTGGSPRNTLTTATMLLGIGAALAACSTRRRLR